MDLSIDFSETLNFFDLSLGVLPDPDLTLRKLNEDTRVFEAIRCDPDVESCIEDRKSWTLLKRWAWHPGDKSEGAGALRDKIAEILSPEKITPHIESMLEAPLYGMIPIEPIWDVVNDLVAPTDFRALPTRAIRFDVRRRPYLRGIGGAISPAPIPEGKIILVRRSWDWEQPYGRKLFSSLFWPVVFRRGGLKFWYDFLDRFGLPRTSATLPKNIYEEKRLEVQASLVSFIRDAVAVFEEGTEINTHESRITGTSDFYERFHRHIGDLISRVITGATLQRDISQKGSFAAASVHGQTGNRRALRDEIMVETAWNEVAGYITRFSGEDAPPPYMHYDRPQDLHAERAERDTRMSAQMGVHFSRDYVVREYGFQDGDIEAVAPGGGGADRNFASHTHPHNETQAAVDEYIAEQMQVGGRIVDAEARQIIRAIRDGGSAAEIEDILVSLAGEDVDVYADLMQKTLVAADMYGRYALVDEIEDAT